MASIILEFENVRRYQFRVALEGERLLVLLHRPAERLCSHPRWHTPPDRWDRGITVLLSPGMAYNPMLGAECIRAYMMMTINWNQFEEYRKTLEGTPNA
jgi:hypothetical protein